MGTLRVAPIVEGHGEVEAIRILLQRIWTETVGGEYIEVLPPIRHPKSKLLQKDGIERAVKLASAMLSQDEFGGLPALILVVVDADEDCPAEPGPLIAERARASTDYDVDCVIAKVEYETWFVGAASSLAGLLHLADGDAGDVEIP